ncbi:SCP-domain-containing protein [Martensiomyces pterosporus]|nr:SCP-domain-containing protein [Martensiomyces pterosporus]
MKFTSLATLFALAVATQASPLVVTITETANAVVATHHVSAPNLRVVTKTVFVTAGSEGESSSDFPTAESSDPVPTATVPLGRGEVTIGASQATPPANPPRAPRASFTSVSHTTSASSVAPPATTTTATGGTGNTDGWVMTMLCRVNAVRAAHGVHPLGLSSELDSIAQKHSSYMSSISDMTHADPDGSLGTRLTRDGIAWSGAAENIAAGMKTPEDAQRALENSPSHLANMVSPNMAYFGAGAANGYYTQNFYALPGNARPNSVPACK